MCPFARLAFGQGGRAHSAGMPRPMSTSQEIPGSRGDMQFGGLAVSGTTSGTATQLRINDMTLPYSVNYRPQSRPHGSMPRVTCRASSRQHTSHSAACGASSRPRTSSSASCLLSISNSSARAWCDELSHMWTDQRLVLRASPRRDPFRSTSRVISG